MTTISVPKHAFLGCETGTDVCMFAMPSNCPDRGFIFAADIKNVRQDGAYLLANLDIDLDGETTLYKAQLLSVHEKERYEGKTVSVYDFLEEIDEGFPDDFSVARKIVLAQKQDVFYASVKESDMTRAKDGYEFVFEGSSMHIPEEDVAKRGSSYRVLFPKNMNIKTSEGFVSTRDIERFYKRRKAEKSVEKT